MHEKDRQVAHERIKLGMSNEFRSNLTNYFLISTTQHFRTEILDIFDKSKIPNESLTIKNLIKMLIFRVKQTF